MSAPIIPESPRQLPLAFGHRMAAGREDFWVASGNAEAVALLDQWPDWGGAVVVVSGPAGAGKSHLAQVFATRVGESGKTALLVNGSAGLTLDPPQLLAQAEVIILDDADAGVDEVSLFHLFNAVREAGRSLVIFCQDAPAQWVSLPDLRSRLSAVPSARIGNPDDALMTAVLVKLFADRQMRVAEEVIDYLLRHMERSFECARALTARIDTVSLAQKRPVTIPLVKQILENL